MGRHGLVFLRVPSMERKRGRPMEAGRICYRHCDDHAVQISMFLFFQAEDGIRAADVTGVQTCALPIFLAAAVVDVLPGRWGGEFISRATPGAAATDSQQNVNYGRREKPPYWLKLVRRGDEFRSEERRGGKANRSQWYDEQG